MEFYRDLVSYIHYIVVILSFIFILFYKIKWDIVYFIKRFYLIFFVWIGITYLCNGCPLTITENYISTQIWGEPFYPEYNFKRSDAYFMFLDYRTYIPLFVYFLITILNVISKNINNGAKI